MDVTEQPSLSIGALAQATSVPVNTLRTWERRHGFPRSVRLPSGHRRFDSDQIVLVRWVIRALEAGYRPSALENLGVDGIRALVAAAQPKQRMRATAGEVSLERWLQYVSSLDTEGLKATMTTAWSQVGAVEFLSTYVTGFLEQIGQGWAEGRFSVAQEHAASACISDFLSTRWRELAQGATGPKVVLGTLPGERHCLGLDQAAVVIALHGLQVHFLGADTPVADIASAAAALDAHAVMLSVSVASPAPRTLGYLEELRGALPIGTELVVGGRGTPNGVPEYMESMRALDAWASSQAMSLDFSH